MNGDKNKTTRVNNNFRTLVRRLPQSRNQHWHEPAASGLHRVFDFVFRCHGWLRHVWIPSEIYEKLKAWLLRRYGGTVLRSGIPPCFRCPTGCRDDPDILQVVFQTWS